MGLCGSGGKDILNRKTYPKFQEWQRKLHWTHCRDRERCLVLGGNPVHHMSAELCDTTNAPLLYPSIFLLYHLIHTVRYAAHLFMAAVFFFPIRQFCKPSAQGPSYLPSQTSLNKYTSMCLLMPVILLQKRKKSSCLAEIIQIKIS